MNVVRTMQNAVQLHQAGRLEEAERIYRQVLAAAPRDPDALHLLGMIEHQHGRHAEAQQLIRKATQIKSNEPIFYLNLAQVNRALGKLDESEHCLRRAIELNPRIPEAHNNLSSLLRLSKRFDEAIASARKALELNPNSGNAHLNVGAAQKDKGLIEEAMESFKRAAQFGAPKHSVLSNMGDSLRALGQYDQARAALEEAIKAAPDMAVAHWNLSLLYLLAGDLLRGFAENEWRLPVFGSEAQRFSQPMWEGQELNGRTLLLWSEQGFGDTIQFVRYVPLLVQRGARVILEVQPPLVSFLEKMDGVAQVVPRGKTVPKCDFQLPFMSLPRVFGTTLQTIPSNVPYLRADEKLLERWQQRIPREPGSLNVGLVWAGNPEHINDRNRSIPLNQLDPLAQVPDVKWFSLQVGPASAQVASSALKPIDLSPDLKDFAQTAAAISTLDLVITVDTAPTHVAGALGKPVWIMLPFVPDWRWLLERPDSVWYPTARLFRQESPGNWASEVAQIESAIRIHHVPHRDPVSPEQI